MRFSAQELDKQEIRNFFNTAEGQKLTKYGANPAQMLNDMYQAKALMGYYRGFLGSENVNKALTSAKMEKEDARYAGKVKAFQEERKNRLTASLRGNEHVDLVSRMVAYDNAWLSASKGSIHTADDFPIAFGDLCRRQLVPEDCETETNWLDWMDGGFSIQECNDGTVTEYDFAFEGDFHCHKPGDDLHYGVITEEGSKFSYKTCHLRQGLKFGPKFRNCADAEQLGRVAELLGQGVRDAVEQMVFSIIDQNVVRYATDVCGYLDKDKIAKILQEIMCNEECCEPDSVIYSRNHIHFPEELREIRDPITGNVIHLNPASVLRNLYPESRANKYLDGDWLLFDSRKKFLVGAVGYRQMRGANARTYNPLVSFKSINRENHSFLGDINDCTFTMATDLDIGFGIRPSAAECLIRVEGCNPCPEDEEMGCFN